MVEHLEQAVGEFEAQIEAALEPFRPVIERLVTIPGVSTTAASVIVAETGVDMGRFASAAQLESWAGMCPGNNESAGKRRTGKTRKGSKWLRQALVEAANAAIRKKGTALGARYRRLLRHLGHRSRPRTKPVRLRPGSRSPRPSATRSSVCIALDSFLAFSFGAGSISLGQLFR
jgi:transposase